MDLIGKGTQTGCHIPHLRIFSITCAGSDPSYRCPGTTSQRRKWLLQQKPWRTGRLWGVTICLQNSGKRFASRTRWLVSGAVCLCDKVWCHGHVPDEWHEAVVSAIFKKRRPGILWKLSPYLISGNRLQAVRHNFVEKIEGCRRWRKDLAHTVWLSGWAGLCWCLVCCKAFVGTNLRCKGGSLAFLALDWAKAFDSISPDGLIVALRCFGVPHGFCSIIRAIYSGRKFVARDAGHTSEPRPQHFGISQGCPLSPFLFSIVMTVFLFHASAKLEMEVETRQPCVLPYRAETHMRCIEAMGMNYGLRLNWKKCEGLPIGCESNITAPDGSFLTCKR